MSLHCLRLGACLAALALTLSVSSSSVLLEEDIRSAAQRSERPAAASGTLMMESVPAMLPEPDPRPVLTQEDVDQALAEVDGGLYGRRCVGGYGGAGTAQSVWGLGLGG